MLPPISAPVRLDMAGHRTDIAADVRVIANFDVAGHGRNRAVYPAVYLQIAAPRRNIAVDATTLFDFDIATIDIEVALDAPIPPDIDVAAVNVDVAFEHLAALDLQVIIVDLALLQVSHHLGLLLGMARGNKRYKQRQRRDQRSGQQPHAMLSLNSSQGLHSSYSIPGAATALDICALRRSSCTQPKIIMIATTTYIMPSACACGVLAKAASESTTASAHASTATEA